MGVSFGEFKRLHYYLNSSTPLVLAIELSNLALLDVIY